MEFNELNDDWILNFENIDNLYKEFYKDDIFYINIKLLYIKRDNQIDKIKNVSHIMSKPNIFSREELLYTIKKYSLDSNLLYSLLSIIKFNFTLDMEELKNLVLNDNNNYNYMNIIKNFDTIYFEKSISMFQKLNELIFVFYEKSKELKIINSNNNTKKIYIFSNTNKKTIKKRYKD